MLTEAVIAGELVYSLTILRAWGQSFRLKAFVKNNSLLV